MLGFGFGWGFVVARAYQPFSEYSHRLVSSYQLVVSIYDVMERPNTAVLRKSGPNNTLLSSCWPYGCQKSSEFLIMRMFNWGITETCPNKDRILWAEIAAIFAVLFEHKNYRIKTRYDKTDENRFLGKWEFDNQMFEMRVKYRNSNRSPEIAAYTSERLLTYW